MALLLRTKDRDDTNSVRLSSEKTLNPRGSTASQTRSRATEQWLAHRKRHSRNVRPRGYHIPVEPPAIVWTGTLFPIAFAAKASVAFSSRKLANRLRLRVEDVNVKRGLDRNARSRDQSGIAASDLCFQRRRSGHEDIDRPRRQGADRRKRSGNGGISAGDEGDGRQYPCRPPLENVLMCGCICRRWHAQMSRAIRERSWRHTKGVNVIGPYVTP
jgi:hypothetical protein